jgi:probable rRNA maturation factor
MRKAKGRNPEAAGGVRAGEGKHSVVYVNNETGTRLPLSRRKLGRCALLVLEAVGAGIEEVSVTFLNDAGMQALNRKYAGLDRPTDVLAFPLPGPENGKMMGDVYISLDRVMSQALEYRVGRREEALRLLVHGVLHLAGYRDDRRPEREKMNLVQERVLRALLEMEA